MEFQVIVTPKAERDLEQIGRYISLDNSEAAEHFCNDLYQTAQSLCRLPKRGRIANQQRNVRRFIYKSYLILYRIDDEARTVEILRFWHAAQDRRRLRLRETPGEYGVPVTQESACPTV